MAATLPPIKGAVHAKGPPGLYSPSPPASGGRSGSGRLIPIRGHKDQLLERHLHPPHTQTILTRYETSVYRNTYKHNLCLDMLEEGYHMSFKELFALIKQQEDARMQSGPESLIWTQVMLKDERNKLDMLKVNLTTAETAERKGVYAEVYAARYRLATYFKLMGDKWLADHFFLTCLQTSVLVEGDEGRTRAQAHCDMGLALEESGQYLDASEHLEAYHKLSSDKRNWMKDDTLSFYTDACIRLYHIYTIIGRRIEDDDPEAALDLLLKALNMAKDSQDKQLEGESAYILGLAYERAGDGETALLHLNDFLAACRDSEDLEGIGRACDAIAKAYRRQGNVESSIDYLKQFVETAEQSGRDSDFSKACHNLGSIFNTLGRYDEATEYFGKAYNVSRSMGENSSMHVNRVQYGIAFAHRMLVKFAKHVEEGEQACLERLVEWKSARTDEFDKPVPEPNAKTPSSERAPQVDTATPQTAEGQEEGSGVGGTAESAE